MPTPNVVTTVPKKKKVATKDGYGLFHSSS